MRSSLECQPCFIRQALDVAKLVSDDEAVHGRVLKRVMRVLSKTDFQLTPPQIAHSVYGAVSKVTGCPDPYLQIKERSDSIALECYGWAKDTVAKSASPLDTAVKLAVAANVVDFGVGVKGDLKEALRTVLEKGLQVDESEALKNALSNAKSLLYIGDNAGEIVMDKLLLESVAAQYPSLKRIFAVRGDAVINDVTMRDAERVGMGDAAEVVSTGIALPGTVIDYCSKEFNKAFKSADLVIAKGQGNYESLNLTQGKKIFFLLRAKCPVIAAELAVPIGSFVVKSVGVKPKS